MKRVLFIFGIALALVSFLMLVEDFRLTGHTIAGYSNPSDPSEWPVYRGFNNGSGYSSQSYPVMSTNVLHNVSSEVVNYRSYSNPVISGDFVYVGDEGEYIRQYWKENLSLFASYRTGNDVIRSPVIADEYVYILSEDGYAYQFNKSNVSSYINRFQFVGTAWPSSLLVHNNSLYFQKGVAPYTIFQLNSTNISLELARFDMGSLCGAGIIIANDYFYAGCADSYIHQFNATNISQQVTNFSGSVAPMGSPVYYNNSIYIASIISGVDNFFQLNATNVSQQLSVTQISNVNAHMGPVAANGYVYPSQSNRVYQLNATNLSGGEISGFTCTGGTTLYSGGLAGDYFYVGCTNDYFYQLNATNLSQQISNISFGRDITSAPAFSEGYVYVTAYTRIYKIGQADLTSPVLNVLSPTAGTYSSSNITFNFTTDEYSNCTYTLDSGTTNNTLQTNGSNTQFENWTTLSDASYTVRFYCTNLAYLTSSGTTVTFTVDAIPDATAAVVEEESSAGFSVSTPVATSEDEEESSEEVVEESIDFSEDDEIKVEDLELDESLDGFDLGGGFFPNKIYSKKVELNVSDFGVVRVTNNDFEEVHYKIVVSDEIKNYILLDQEEVTLSPNEDFDLKFDILPISSPGKYEGRIYLVYSNKDIARVVPVLIEVKPFWKVALEVAAKVSFLAVFFALLFLLYLIVRRYIKLRNQLGGYENNTQKLEKLESYRKRSASKGFLLRFVDRAAIKMAQKI